MALFRSAGFNPFDFDVDIGIVEPVPYPRVNSVLARQAAENVRAGLYKRRFVGDSTQQRSTDHRQLLVQEEWSSSSRTYGSYRNYNSVPPAERKLETKLEEVRNSMTQAERETYASELEAVASAYEDQCRSIWAGARGASGAQRGHQAARTSDCGYPTATISVLKSQKHLQSAMLGAEVLRGGNNKKVVESGRSAAPGSNGELSVVLDTSIYKFNGADLQSVVWLKSIFAELLARGLAEHWPAAARAWTLELFLDYPYGSPELAPAQTWQDEWVQYNTPHRPSWIAWPAKVVLVLAKKTEEVIVGGDKMTALEKYRAIFL